MPMEGTACYSLTGYLSLKPSGALSLVLPIRRYWSAFNDLTQTLEFYQSERDLINQKSPVETIQLHRAAITLSPSDERVFIILTNTREYHLRAENHEALMIWLLGLQSKRDASIPTRNGLIMNDTESGFDFDEVINNEEMWRNYRSDSLSRSDYSKLFLADRNTLLDSSNDEEKPRQNSILENTQPTTSFSSNLNFHLCDTCTFSLCPNCRSTSTRPLDSFPNRTGSSSHSIESSDSAFYDQASHQFNLPETLLTLKCEVASLINKENTYQMIIKEKTETIRKLEKQLADILQAENALQKNQSIYKVFNERTRQTNNELKFLHCEINKIHRILRDDDIKMRKLIKTIRVQQTQRESLQRDYIFLLQTALSTEDGRLCGGTKHRERLKELLNECRKRDPSLPSYDSLEGSGIYIDSYGFKHEKNNENDRLQYICVKLTQFYDTKSRHIDENLWKSSLKTYQSSSVISKTFKTLVRQGIPHHLRAEVWQIFIHKQIEHVRKEKGYSYYENLCHLLPNSDLSHKFEKQIALDLYRTMPTNIRFSNKDSDGIRQLRQVLQVFCLHNPAIGYCQGMNFIVAVALLLLEPEDAFWLLISITECHLTNYYDAGLIGAQVDQYVLKELIEQNAPDIHQHFEINEVEITSLTLNWFMAIFIDSVPFETLLRIWDCFLIEGGKVLFRFALAILIINRENILTRTDTISMMKQIKDSTKNLIDVETLFKIAFEDLKPFCHRKDIAVKQAYWTKMLVEKVVRRQISRDGYTKRDYVFQEMNQTSTTLDCAVVLSDKLVWIAFGSQMALHLYEVNVERGLMLDLGINYNSRAFCMSCVNSELVLVGTLCGALLGFSIDDRQILWATQLRNCLLCITSLNKISYNRIYCGLSDGNLAIVQLQNSSEPEEAFCITVDNSAVTAVAYRNEKLWCLTSNKMTILNEKTLDILSTIDLTYENLDSTSLIYSDDGDPEHLWILLRSTNNILQAWNQTDGKLHGTISLNHLFDQIGKTDEQLAVMKGFEHDTADYPCQIADHIRITSLLIHDQQLWIVSAKVPMSQRSFSITNPLPDFLHRRRQSRSRSDSAMIGLAHSSDEYCMDPYLSNRYLYRLTFLNQIETSRRRKRNPSTNTYPIMEKAGRREFDETETSTTLTSIKSHSSSPAVISTDEWLDENRRIQLPKTSYKSSKALQASEAFSFNLLFKAKIADAPVKCICKTKCNDQTVILTCSGKLGDDEVVCRWKQVPATNQWTNDVIVEVNPETLIPIRPLYARQQYLKAQRDRSISMSSMSSKP